MQSSVTRSRTSITKSLPASFKPSISPLFSESYIKMHCFKLQNKLFLTVEKIVTYRDEINDFTTYPESQIQG